MRAGSLSPSPRRVHSHSQTARATEHRLRDRIATIRTPIFGLRSAPSRRVASLRPRTRLAALTAPRRSPDRRLPDGRGVGHRTDINCSDDGRTAASGRYEVQAARFVDELVNAQDMSADFVRRLFVHVLFACQFRATISTARCRTPRRAGRQDSSQDAQGVTHPSRMLAFRTDSRDARRLPAFQWGGRSIRIVNPTRLVRDALCANPRSSQWSRGHSLTAHRRTTAARSRI